MQTKALRSTIYRGKMWDFEFLHLFNDFLSDHSLVPLALDSITGNKTDS